MSTATASARLANVERLRIVSMLEIVGFHANGRRLPGIAALGLPLFLVLTSLFNCTLADRHGLRGLLRLKLGRLALPWALWSAIYGLLLGAQALHHHVPLAEVFSASMLLTGPYYHLWFVPFALFAGLVVGALRVTSARRGLPLCVIGAVVAAALVALVPAWLGPPYPEGTAEQWLFSLPSPFLGFALGCAFSSRDRRLLGAAVAGVAALCAAGFALGSEPTREAAYRYGISALLVFAALDQPGEMDPLTNALSPLLLGVYLVHPLLIRVLGGCRLGRWGDLPCALLFFALSLAVVGGLRRTPLRALT